MKISRILQPPIVVDTPTEQWQVPRVNLTQFTEWGAEFDQRILDQAGDGMTPAERFQHIAYIGLMPLNLPAIKRLCLTPEGIRRTLTITMSQARVIAEREDETKPFKLLDQPRSIADKDWKNFIEFGSDTEKDELVRLVANIPPDPGLMVPTGTGASKKASGTATSDEQGEAEKSGPLTDCSKKLKSDGPTTGT